MVVTTDRDDGTGPAHGGGGRGGRVREWLSDRGFLVLLRIGVLLVIGLVLLASQWFRGAFDRVPVSSPRPGDPPVGSCLARAGDIPVPGACAALHWGEVIGYRPLGPAEDVGPRSDRARAVAAFECRWLLAAEELPDAGLTTWASISPEPWPNPDSGTDEHYVTCVAHRSAGEELLGPGPALSPGDAMASDDVSVPMRLDAASPADNAPPGACLWDGAADAFRTTFLGGRGSTDTGTVQVVRCEGWTNRRVLAHPVLYRWDTPWPGEEQVVAAARQACDDIAADELPPGSWSVQTHTPGRAWFGRPDVPDVYATCTASSTWSGRS